jgi:hypothetical protein
MKWIDSNNDCLVAKISTISIGILFNDFLNLVEINISVIFSLCNFSTDLK